LGHDGLPILALPNLVELAALVEPFRELDSQLLGLQISDHLIVEFLLYEVFTLHAYLLLQTVVLHLKDILIMIKTSTISDL
jgi:hypothetical protein